MQTHNIKWTVSLSNGETLYEGKGDFKEVEGEDSPYRKLLKHLDKKDLKITSLGLYNDNNSRWNLPSAGKNPKFKAFDDAEKPKDYRFFRKIGADILSGVPKNEEVFAVIEAQFENYKLQLWVRDDSPHESWVLVL